jgi:nucleoside 2-deoxyribosyltransferase
MAARLAELGFVGRSPLRGKGYLRGLGKLEDQYLGLHPLSEDAGIVCRDRNDVNTAAAVVLNLVGAERVSIGTMVELGWADAARVPTIVIMEKGNVHDHSFVRQLAGYVVEDPDTALDILATILGADLDTVVAVKEARA